MNNQDILFSSVYCWNLTETERYISYTAELGMNLKAVLQKAKHPLSKWKAMIYYRNGTMRLQVLPQKDVNHLVGQLENYLHTFLNQ